MYRNEKRRGWIVRGDASAGDDDVQREKITFCNRKSVFHGPSDHSFISGDPLLHSFSILLCCCHRRRRRPVYCFPPPPPPPPPPSPPTYGLASSSSLFFYFSTESKWGGCWKRDVDHDDSTACCIHTETHESWHEKKEEPLKILAENHHDSIFIRRLRIFLRPIFTSCPLFMHSSLLFHIQYQAAQDLLSELAAARTEYKLWV